APPTVFRFPRAMSGLQPHFFSQLPRLRFQRWLRSIFLMRSRPSYLRRGLTTAWFQIRSNILKPATTCAPWRERLGECLFQVGDEVFYVFDAHGDAYEAVGYSKACALLGGNGRMGHRCRMRDQSLDAAQTFSERT